jgi:hypothetical protein
MIVATAIRRRRGGWGRAWVGPAAFGLRAETVQMGHSHETSPTVRRGMSVLAPLTVLALQACSDPVVFVSSDGDEGGHHLAVLSHDGGWCWFEGPRAVVAGDRLLVGTVATGLRDPQRRGDVEALAFELSTKQGRVVELHDQLQADDHASPGLLMRPDRRFLAVYAGHGVENRFYYRISEPNDATSWSDEHVFTPSDTTALTYSNVFQLPMENGRIYNFYRGLDGDPKPSYAFSDDLAETWQSGSIFIRVPDAPLQRPYVCYASNEVDTIHMVYTEGHPRDYDNSLYHAYYRSGTLHASDGTAIAPLSVGLDRPQLGTRIFQGDPDHVAWGVDVALDVHARPAVVFSVQVGSAGRSPGQGGEDLRYWYARWDGSTWVAHEMAFAGTRLYAGEDDYSGLAAMDPSDTSAVFISTNADPQTGEPLVSHADDRRHYEIYEGHTEDGGVSWGWAPITRNSTVDNLRPVVPKSDGPRILLWLRGVYSTFSEYDLEVVARW